MEARSEKNYSGNKRLKHAMVQIAFILNLTKKCIRSSKGSNDSGNKHKSSFLASLLGFTSKLGSSKVTNFNDFVK